MGSLHPARLHVRLQVGEKALTRGLKESQLRLHGLVVRPEFSAPLPCKADLRAKLGLDQGAKVAMLVGGGEGMGPVEETVKAISKSGCELQLVVICGKNKVIADRLKARTWAPSMKLVVQVRATDFTCRPSPVSLCQVIPGSFVPGLPRHHAMTEDHLWSPVAPCCEDFCRITETAGAQNRRPAGICGRQQGTGGSRCPLLR